MTLKRRTTATLAAIAALLTGCSSPAGSDPAAIAAIAYYDSGDKGTSQYCELTWAYRTEPGNLANCRSNPSGGQNAIVSMEVVRTAALPGPSGGPGKALTLTMTLKGGSAVYAVAMAQDEGGRWFWVKEESLSKPPATDDELIAALA